MMSLMYSVLWILLMQHVASVGRRSLLVALISASLICMCVIENPVERLGPCLINFNFILFCQTVLIMAVVTCSLAFVALYVVPLFWLFSF